MRYDFDPPDSDSVDRVAVDEFIALLTEWLPVTPKLARSADTSLGGSNHTI